MIDDKDLARVHGGGKYGELPGAVVPGRWRYLPKGSSNTGHARIWTWTPLYPAR